MARPFPHARFLLLLLAAAVLPGAQAGWGARLTTEVGKFKTEQSWRFFPGINGGYNKLISGYTGYKNLGNAGLDLYIQPPRDTPQRSEFHHNLMGRFSFDYFPLQVPDGNYGLSEDILSVNSSLLYLFHGLHRQREARSVVFTGLGIGYYQDRISLDTPASGSVSGTHTNFGFIASLGAFLPRMKLFRIPFRFSPEIRYHRIKVVDGYSANMTFQIGMVFWPEIN